MCDLYQTENSSNIPVVFPPCDVDAFSQFSDDSNNLEETKAEKILRDEQLVHILSVGQIRPEKNHRLQLEAFHAAKLLNEEKGDVRVNLIFDYYFVFLLIRLEFLRSM